MLIGTIIGAGIFALPAAFTRVGFWPATVLFWFLAAVVLVTHLFFAEIHLWEGARVRLAGAAKREFGPAGFWLATLTYPLQIIGANVAYLILGGDFLAALAKHWSMPIQLPLLLWQLLFWIGAAWSVLIGLRLVAKLESLATWFLIGSLLLIAVLTLRSSWAIAVAQSWSSGKWELTFVPFGVFLFSLTGLSVIGEVVEILRRRRQEVYRAITVGSLGAALISWVFAVALFAAGGTRGGETILLLPAPWGWLLPLAGFLAVATSFIPLAEDLKETCAIDFHFSERAAWGLALCLPLILLFLTARNFLATIGVVGSVFGATNGILVALVAWHMYARRNGTRRPPAFGRALLVGIVVAVYLGGILHWFFF